ncbi:MAG: hypothetical protein IT434_01905 [Phycisphaerales bacterium]|jgi:hypothetical protein|nr:hypothetical protein [Phycisphaerales bacterium]
MHKLALMTVLASAGVALAGPVQSHHAAESHAWMPPIIARSVLWDQSITSGNATVDQNFPDFPDYSSGMVDDFSTGAQAWNITKVTTYFTRGVGNWSDDVTQAQLSLFSKAGSIPGEPDVVGNLGLVDVSLASSLDGQAWAVAADTSSIAALQNISGEFWIGLTPVAAFGSFGQEFHLLSALPTVGGGSAIRNAGGAFGFGTGWTDAGSLDLQPGADMLFTLEGEVVPSPGSAAVLVGWLANFAGRKRPQRA